MDSKSLVEQGYDRVAGPYLAWSAPRPTTTRFHYLDKLVASLPKGAKVLELGCGAGIPCTQTLIKKGIHVTGVDISAAQIALARQHIPEATLIQSDMMGLSFLPESFDAVLAFYSIFHLPKEEQSIMIGCIKGWLKHGGYLLCNFAEEGDVIREGWFDPSVTMFSSGLGVEGTRAMFNTHSDTLKVLADEVAMEEVGRTEVPFLWIMAVKIAAI